MTQISSLSNEENYKNSPNLPKHSLIPTARDKNLVCER